MKTIHSASTVTALTAIASSDISSKSWGEIENGQKAARQFFNSLPQGVSISMMKIDKIVTPLIQINADIAELLVLSADVTLETSSLGQADYYSSGVRNVPVTLNDIVGFLRDTTSISSDKLLGETVSFMNQLQQLATIGVKSATMTGETRWIGFDKGDALKISKCSFKGANEIEATGEVKINGDKGVLFETLNTGHVFVATSGDAFAVSGNPRKSEMSMTPIKVSKGDNGQPVFSYLQGAETLMVKKTKQIKAALDLVRTLTPAPFTIQGRSVTSISQEAEIPSFMEQTRSSMHDHPSMNGAAG